MRRHMPAIGYGLTGGLATQSRPSFEAHPPVMVNQVLAPTAVAADAHNISQHHWRLATRRTLRLPLRRRLRGDPASHLVPRTLRMKARARVMPAPMYHAADGDTTEIAGPMPMPQPEPMLSAPSLRPHVMAHTSSVRVTTRWSLVMLLGLERIAGRLTKLTGFLELLWAAAPLRHSHPPLIEHLTDFGFLLL